MTDSDDDGHMEDFERFGRITASVAGAILRVEGEKKSPAWAWRCVTGREPRDENPWIDIKRGLMHEKDAIGTLEIELGTLVSKGRFVPHPTISWLGASPDGFIQGDGILIPCEAKCPRILHTDIPPLYVPQVQIQMECCNAPHAFFVSWVAESDFQFVKKVDRDPVWWEWAFPLLEEFYLKYVKPDIEPPRAARRSKKNGS